MPFTRVTVDTTANGDCKAIGDINGDGVADMLVGGHPTEKLNWYDATHGYAKTVIATPNIEFTEEMSLGDIDGNGSLDVLVTDGNTGNNLVWFKNPRPTGNPSVGSQWTRQTIGALNTWGKGVAAADIDHNGLMDVAARSSNLQYIFFQTAPGTWLNRSFTSSLGIGTEGMTVADIDGDGNADIVSRGFWLRNPGGTASTSLNNWNKYNIGTFDQNFKAVVADINHDGKPDIVTSSSEGTADLAWWSYGAGPTGTWTSHTIVPNLSNAHTLAVADMNGDGKLDVIVGQMLTSTTNQISIYFNVDGQGNQWQQQVVDTTGIHNGAVGDVNGDGYPDIMGDNYTGPPVWVWLNNYVPEPGALVMIIAGGAIVFFRGRRRSAGN